MAYSNFKATVWSKYIQTELKKHMVFEDVVNTKFQGEAGQGKTVKIIGAARPSVLTYVPGTNINAAETPADSSVYLTLDQLKYTHFIVDDVDEAQSCDGLMEAYMEQSVNALSEDADKYIASLAKDATLASASTKISTAAEAKKAVNDALSQLYENGCTQYDEISIVLPAWLYLLFRDSMTSDLSSNVELVNKGIIGKYSGANILLSNNLYSDGTDEYCMAFTKNAIAYASGIDSVEAYRPENTFADAVKSLHTYGAKLVRPGELYVIKAHK